MAKVRYYMIKNKTDLKYYLEKDVEHHGTGLPKFKDFVLKNEWWYLYHYLYHLRHVEYYINSVPRNILLKIVYKALYLFHFIKYKRLSSLLHLYIYPNTCGAGLKICHFGDFTHVAKGCVIGDNCVLLPGVVLGKKDEYDVSTTIGDNCYLGLGVKILGSVTVGNNVVVGANAVVTKDIPANVVVAGVPAEIIKKR